MKDSLPQPEDRFIKLSLNDIRNMITFLLSIQQTFSDKYGEHKYIHKMSNTMIDLFLDQLSIEDRNSMIGESNG
tara:strand:- start:596 stop:817 length:222 start_codon:yes stop_codon:yes gene_type:complete